MSQGIYLTYKQASSLLEIPMGTMYSLVRTKRIPHVRLGPRSVRFIRTDLERWMQEHRVSEGE